jgi:hypothetical protein
MALRPGLTTGLPLAEKRKSLLNACAMFCPLSNKQDDFGAEWSYGNVPAGSMVTP